MFLPHILAENALISEANVPASNGGCRLFYGSAPPLYSQCHGNAPKEQGEGATYTPLMVLRHYGLRLCTIIAQARCAKTKFDPFCYGCDYQNRTLSKVFNFRLRTKACAEQPELQDFCRRDLMSPESSLARDLMCSLSKYIITVLVHC